MSTSVIGESKDRFSNERRPAYDVMEGNGAYNKHAKLPGDAANLALPLLDKAVRRVELDSGEPPIVIADYGSSQGKNSQAPMRVAIRRLRDRAGRSRAISVFHIDQPSNDFNSLFEVLDADPERYVADDQDVYPAAIGKSFYQRVLPPSSVHLGWSSYAVVWLSRVPGPIPGHFIAIRCNGPVRAAFDRQSAQDWETFLSLRAEELRPGGRLIVVIPGMSDDGVTGFESMFDEANAVLEEMVAEGAITSDERSRMVVRGHPRRKSDLYAPFRHSGQFQDLTVEAFAMSEVPDSAWAEYEQDGDNERLARKRARFWRAVFVPSLASGLTYGGDPEVRAAFADRLERGLTRHLTSQALPLRSYVQTIVLAKSA